MTNDAPEAELPVCELPLAARNAIVHLLLVDLATMSDTGSGGVGTALRLLSSDSAPGASDTSAARSVRETLRSAGLAGSDRGDAASSDAERSVVAAAYSRLTSYRRVLDGAPRGVDRATRLVQAGLLFEHGLFFEVHEVLEPEWRAAVGDDRTVLQGIIRAAVAWHHRSRGRLGPAVRSRAAALDKLRRAPATWHGFSIEKLRDALQRS